MAEIFKIKTVTNGWTGGPGLSQMFFSPASTGSTTQGDVDAAAAAVRTFWAAVKGFFPPSWTAQVQSDVETLDPATGHLTGLMSTSAPPFVSGTGGNYGPTSSGAAVTWRAPVVLGRRLARGRTFLTPCGLNAYDTTGLVVSGASSAFQSAGQGLIADTTCQLVIWHRPSKVSPAGGLYTPATSASCSSKPVVLRSRRD